jgi:trans-aconitate 2-methyltransferase
MTWSARQYLAFEAERTRPVRDLLAAVPAPGAGRAIDLGCGPGNSTQVLAEGFPDLRIEGLDSSPDMVEAARRRLPKVGFEVADVETWDAPGPFDVILANAVFQWLGGHERLFPRLLHNLDEPAHRLMREVAADGPWAQKLAAAAVERTSIQSPAWYFGLLAPLSSSVDVWRTTYHHPLAGADALVEWFKGTGLRPFLDPLDPDEREAFLARYRDAIAAAYPALPDGTVLLPFPRLFIVAVR